MASFSENKIVKLRDSINWSNRQLNYTRKKRVSATRQFVGYHYAEGGSELRVPVNMLALAVLIYVRQLAARTPRVLVTTKRIDLKPIAANLELAINQVPDEINLEDTLQRLVIEAMFSMGIVKVGLHTVGSALGHEYGEPFVDVVTIDDYFCDMSAKNFDLIDYEGNDYWLDYDEVMESTWADNTARVDLKSDEYTTIGPNGEKRAEGIMNNESASVFRDKIWLRDVWLPKEKLLVTYGVKSEKILKTVDWDGPDFGPYPKLGYGVVPGNLLPLAPVSLWRDLHELANELFRKLGDGAKSQKTVQGFPGGDDEAVQEFKSAKDGEGIKWTGGDPKILQAGGINPTTLAFFLQTKQLSSYVGGNLDSLGGLGIQAQTVGQEKLLGDAASAQLRDMADKTIICIKKIFKAIAYYEWNDPIKHRLLEKPIPGIDMVLPVEWNRDSKEGELSNYDLNIDVYSAQDNSPSIKLQKVRTIWKEDVLPAQASIQQAGGTINIQKYYELVAKLSDTPEIAELVEFPDQPPQVQGASAAQSPGMPTNTTRTTERIGRPGMTPQGADAAMMQVLMGGNPGGTSPQPQ